MDQHNNLADAIGLMALCAVYRQSLAVGSFSEAEQWAELALNMYAYLVEHGR